MGVGEGRENAKVLDFATADLQAIAGQRPVVTRAKKSIFATSSSARACRSARR